jgi:hypothetical protein
MTRRERRCRARRRCRAKRLMALRAKAAVAETGSQRGHRFLRPVSLVGKALGDLRTWAMVCWRWSIAWKHEHKRSGAWWGSMVMLLITAVGTFFTVYGVVRPTPSAARLNFRAGVREGSAGMRSFATPDPGDILPVRLSLTPYNQDLGGLAVVITPPPGAVLTADCYYSVGDGGRHRCALPGGQGRIDLARLASRETLRLSVKVKVLAFVDSRESITFEMSSAEADASLRQVDLYSP